MKKERFIKMSIVLMALLIPFWAAAAGIEDPYYKQWSSFKAGSSVTYVGRSVDNTGTESFTQTITLKELGNDRVVIEIVRKSDKAEMVKKSKKVDRFTADTDKIEYRGQEEITVAGKQFTCQRYTSRIMDDKGKEMMKFDYWFHPDIPGAARIAAESSYGVDLGLGKSEATQSAVSWEKK
jgi:hypothetical protein